MLCMGLSTDMYYVTGSRVPRFDPTAYIQDRQRRQREAELKKLVSTFITESSQVFDVASDEVVI